MDSLPGSIMLSMLVLLVLDSLLLAGAIAYFAWIGAKKTGEGLKQALDLAHQVASDAMLHLKSQTPLDYVAAKGMEKQQDESLEMLAQKWLDQRIRDQESQKPGPSLIDLDGNEHKVDQFVPIDYDLDSLRAYNEQEDLKAGVKVPQ